MILFLLWILVTLSALTYSGVLLVKNLDKVDLFETEKMSVIEIIVQGMCCIILCAFPVLNIWFLGYLIYHRKSLVDRSVHWIIVASEFNGK